VTARAERLANEVNRLKARVKELENELQNRKNFEDTITNCSETSGSPCGDISHHPDPSADEAVTDGVGALSIGHAGSSRFYGNSASAEVGSYPRYAIIKPEGS
jgi:hypothetical protein